MPLGPPNLRKNSHIRWLRRSVWRVFYRWSVCLCVEWVAIYCGANWITRLHGHRVTLRTDFDFTLPFVPSAAIVYLSLFPMLWLAPFVLYSPARLRAFARALAILILISGIGFVFLPAEPIDEISIGTHPFGGVFQFADWLNLTYNYFPSLHVGMAVVCAVSFSRTARPTAAIFYWPWAVTIALATLLTHQHYVVDVIAGGALGAIVATRSTSDASNSHRVWKP